jgi:hypothetical protein
LPIPTAQFRFGEKEMPLEREWFLPAVYNKGYSNARRSAMADFKARWLSKK